MAVKTIVAVPRSIPKDNVESEELAGLRKVVAACSRNAVASRLTDDCGALMRASMLKVPYSLDTESATVALREQCV